VLAASASSLQLALTHLCADIFKHLPVAAIVRPGTLVVHGGLWRKPPQPKKRGPGKRQCMEGDVGAAAPPPMPAVQLGSLDDLRKSNKGGQEPQGGCSARDVPHAHALH